MNWMKDGCAPRQRKQFTDNWFLSSEVKRTEAIDWVTINCGKRKSIVIITVRHSISHELFQFKGKWSRGASAPSFTHQQIHCWWWMKEASAMRRQRRAYRNELKFISFRLVSFKFILLKFIHSIAAPLLRSPAAAMNHFLQVIHGLNELKERNWSKPNTAGRSRESK